MYIKHVSFISNYQLVTNVIISSFRVYNFFSRCLCGENSNKSSVLILNSTRMLEI